MDKTFSIRKAFAYGWHATWDNLLLLVTTEYVIYFLPVLIILPLFFLGYFALGNSLSNLPVFMAQPIVANFFHLFAFVLAFPLCIGFAQMFFAIYDNKTVSYRMIFKPLHDCCLLIRALFGTLFYTLAWAVLLLPGYVVLVKALKRPDFILGKIPAVVFGILATVFVVGWMIWSLRSMFFYFFIVDKDRGPIRAIRDSLRLTKGHTVKLLGFVLATLLLALIAGGFSVIPTMIIFLLKFQHAMIPILLYIISIVFGLIIYPLFLAFAGQASVYVFRKLVAR